MRLLCVQCLKVNDVTDDVQPDDSGKVRVECPGCGFVTVITRRAPGQKKADAPAARPAPRPERRPEPAPIPEEPIGAEAGSDSTNPQNLYDNLFDESVEAVGDWMVRHLDGTEVGPLSFDDIKDMISTGKLGKIDEVRKLDERYVPAAFHEATAELFNELETTGI